MNETAPTPMDTGPLHTVVRHLRRLAGTSRAAPSADAQLLARFTATRDDAAFAEIVRRHGPLVWALCRNGLSAADADDAYQATFLVLARKATAIRRPSSLACWLSGVARRVAQQARTRTARRSMAALPDNLSAASSTADELDRADWRRVLAEELDRLPEKYRLPLILCYYQGLTNEEAARRLDWPHGTVCGRLARARELLRGRLERRGVTLAVGMLAAGVVAPPTELLAASLRTTMATGTKSRLSVIQLAEEAMNAMWLKQAATWAAAGIIAISLTGAAGWSLLPATAQQNPVPLPAAPMNNVGRPQPAADPNPDILLTQAEDAIRKSKELSKAEPADDVHRALLKDRHRTALEEWESRMMLFKAGSERGPLDVLINAIERVCDAERALSQRPADHATAYQRALTFATVIENLNKARHETGRIPRQDYLQSRYHRLDFEIKWRDATAKGPAK